MTTKRRKQPVELNPIVYRFNQSGSLTEANVTTDMKAVINKQAIEIFTEASNAGQPFQAALGAVLMSGLMWGLELKEVMLNEV